MKKFVLILALFIGVEVQAQDWKANANVYEVNIRQYTPQGTFNAFASHLPRIKRLGIDIIWLMPVQPIGEKNRKGELGSYYSVKDYTAVNPEFGTEAEFQNLVNQAHALGMKVIIDWVANHSAWDNPWTVAHPDWYQKDSTGGFMVPYDWTDVIALDYSNKGMRKGMIDAMNYWVKTFGIDGFRCDVAYLVPVDFWDQARKTIDKNHKQYWLAEAESPELMKTFDVCYNWKLLHTMNSIAKGEKSPTDIIDYQKDIDTLFKKGVTLLSFVTNHDENSWNGTEYDRYGDRVALFTILAFTLNGQPLVYSGQEAGLNKALRFFAKDTIEWDTFPQEELITQLLELRHTEPALWSGNSENFPQFSKHVNAQCLVYTRKSGQSEITVLANFSAKPATFFVRTNQEVEDVLGNRIYPPSSIITVPAGQAIVLKITNQ